MEPTEIILNLLFSIGVILFLYTGITLLRKGFRNKQTNLNLLGIAHILTAIFYPLVVFTDSWIMINLIFFITHLCLLWFVDKTFYTKSRQSFNILFGLVLSTGIFLSILSYLTLYNVIEKTTTTRFIDIIGNNFISVSTFLWYGTVSLNSFRNLKNEAVEPWILVRLKLTTISAFVFAWMQIPDFLRINVSIDYADPNDPISMFVFISQVIFVMFFSVAQFLAWVMPKQFKSYLNRNFNPGDDTQTLGDISKEEVLKMLK